MLDFCCSWALFWYTTISSNGTKSLIISLIIFHSLICTFDYLAHLFYTQSFYYCNVGIKKKSHILPIFPTKIPNKCTGLSMSRFLLLSLHNVSLIFWFNDCDSDTRYTIFHIHHIFKYKLNMRHVLRVFVMNRPAYIYYY